MKLLVCLFFISSILFAQDSPSDGSKSSIFLERMYETQKQKEYYYQIKTIHLKKWNAKMEEFLSSQNVNYKKNICGRDRVIRVFFKKR